MSTQNTKFFSYFLLPHLLVIILKDDDYFSKTLKTKNPPNNDVKNWQDTKVTQVYMQRWTGDKFYKTNHLNTMRQLRSLLLFVFVVVVVVLFTIRSHVRRGCALRKKLSITQSAVLHVPSYVTYVPIHPLYNIILKYISYIFSKHTHTWVYGHEKILAREKPTRTGRDRVQTIQTSHSTCKYIYEILQNLTSLS